MTEERLEQIAIELENLGRRARTAEQTLGARADVAESRLARIAALCEAEGKRFGYVRIESLRAALEMPSQ